jgi:hypothetical protein
MPTRPGLSTLLDANAEWCTIGATALFITVETGNALHAQAQFVRARVDAGLFL